MEWKNNVGNVQSRVDVFGTFYIAAARSAFLIAAKAKGLHGRTNQIGYFLKGKGKDKGALIHISNRFGNFGMQDIFLD